MTFVSEVVSLKVAGNFVGALQRVSLLLQNSQIDLIDSSLWAQLMNNPTTFERPSDHEANVLFMTAAMTLLDSHCHRLEPAIARGVVDNFLKGCHFRQSAHSDVNIKPLMQARARLFFRSSYVLPNHDYTFGTAVANPKRPRVGVIFRHMHADPETTSLLPFFSEAKKNGIELIIFVQKVDSLDIFGKEMVGLSSQVVELPANLVHSVDLIRATDLDILIFGNDVTAKLSLGACLSFHRVARRAICTVSTLVTTASPYVDEYFGCEYHFKRGAAEEFCERFVHLPSPGFAFSFSKENKIGKVLFSPRDMGLNNEDVFFVSGANHTKLHGPVLDTWAAILKRCPNSVIFLYPYPPHFGPARESITARIRARFASHGVSPSRVLILPQLPDRHAVKSLLTHMDIGLDSFPYPGVTTIVDAIESNLPTVTLAGRTLRSAQAGAVLATAGLQDLVTFDVDEYIDKAVAIAHRPEYRKALVDQIVNARAGLLPFVDGSLFGKAANKEYFRIHGELKKQ